MLEYDNGGKLVESAAELPAVPASIDELFLDFETRSGDPKLDSLHPWHNCRPCGFAVTWDGVPGSWYVPVDHDHGPNVDRGAAYAFLRDVVSRSKRWVNHNVKYDAHVYQNCVGDLPNGVKLTCTVVGSKIVDSDRQFKGGYGLDALSRYWLHEEIGHLEEALQPYLFRNKDYGRIPSDVCGHYASQDVITNRRLLKYLDSRRHPECDTIWGVEQRLTRTLFGAEQFGMAVDRQELKIKELLTIAKMLKLEQELTQVVGRSFRPHVNEDCYEVLCIQYGLPVLAWTGDEDAEEESKDRGNPSFDKSALAGYMTLPTAPKDVIKKIVEYRKLNNFLGLFVTVLRDENVDGVVHSQYNQLVRTGRMSCKKPNAQQQDKRSKELFHPRPGNSYLSADASQIEFRFITHYIKDQNAIDAYNRDPDTDFHVWVASLCGVKRKPAKTLNFMMGFGGGKAKTVASVAKNEDVIGEITGLVEQLVADGKVKREDSKLLFDQMCERRALAMYETYHASLPNLKKTSRQAARVCETRGYVKTIMGRHRHINPKKAHIAFNTVNQGSAADLMKERMVSLDDVLKGTPLSIVASVHDEILLEGPTELVNDPRTHRDLANFLEHPPIKLRVPIRWGVGASDQHWAGAGEAAKPVHYDPARCGLFDHCR